MARYSSDSEDDRRSKRRRQRSKSRSRRSRSRSLSSRDSYSSSRSSRKKAKKSKKKQKKRSRSRSSDRDYRRRRSRSRSRTRRRSRSRSRSRRSYSRERRSRSGSYYRSRRRRSRSYRRSYSRSPGKSRSRRNSRSRSRSRRRSRSKSNTRDVSKTEEIPPTRAEDPCADIPGFHEMTPAEQNAVRMKMALKAAAETTARLREQGIFTGSAPGDAEKRQKAIADIEDEGFVQTNFKSSRSNPRVKEESAEDHHEAAMFGDVTSLATIPKAIVYKNTDSILAPIFYEDPDVKWDRWVDHVREYRRKKLEGEAMT